MKHIFNMVLYEINYFVVVFFIFIYINVTGSQTILNDSSQITHEKVVGYFAQLGGGVSLPMMDINFKSSTTPFYNVNGCVGYYMDDYFAWGIHAEYNTFKNDQSFITGNMKLSVLTITANIYVGAFSNYEKICPYGYFGFGLANFSLSGVENNSLFGSTNRYLGLRLGAGAYYKLDKNFGVFGETGLNYIFNKGTAKGYVPVNIGAMFYLPSI